MSFMLLGILNSQAAGGGAAPAFELLDSYTTTGSTSSFSFSGLSSYTDYKYLKIIGSARSQRNANPADDLWVGFNGVRSGYETQLYQGNGSSSYAYSNGGTKGINLLVNTPQGSQSGTGSFVIDINDWADNTKDTNMMAFYGYNNEGANGRVAAMQGLTYDSTSSISSIDFVSEDANLFGSLTVSLYGIKA